MFGRRTLNYPYIGYFGLLFVQVSHCIQIFDKEPSYTEVNPGQEAVINCKILNKKGTCSWQKDGKPIGTHEGKYEWAGNTDLGDCSLRILNAVLSLDDGEWECQVTAATFQSQDALTSRPVKVVVRVPPYSPLIEQNIEHVKSGGNLTVQEGQKSIIKCISRNGNPPAIIKWFIDDLEVTQFSNQTNSTEFDNNKLWSATSILEYSFMKVQNGRRLRCVAVHEAYDTKSREIHVFMDVQYPPSVRMQGAPTDDLEENIDSVYLRCAVDANPPADVIWRKMGHTEIFSLKELLEFRPVTRDISGGYQCEAKNSLGFSEALTVEIDIKYPPKILDTDPKRSLTVSLFNSTRFTCDGDGNPPPKYEWLQRSSANDILIRGTTASLFIHNITYEMEGEYVCSASNMIKGKERRVQSSPIQVSVFGPPQIFRHFTKKTVVDKGDDALLSAVFCADPAPSKIAWEWGSLKLEAGNGKGRFVSENLIRNRGRDCYEARLRVQKADVTDSRYYFLQIENERGFDRYGIPLEVAESVSMSMMIGIVIASLILLVIVVLVILHAFKTERCCFSQRGNFKPTEIDSDIESTKGSVHNGPGSSHCSNLGMIPPDALYSKEPQRRDSPKSVSSRLGSDCAVAKNRAENKGRGDIIYADLQLPKTSNNGSMRLNKPALEKTNYAEIKFPVYEKADL